MFNVYKNQQSRQTGSRNLMGPKTLPTIWGTYMKLLFARYIFISSFPLAPSPTVSYKPFGIYIGNFGSFQTLLAMGPKTLPTIWGTYMKLVTKYQISAINSY
jgi:hypothetical protein